MRQYETHSFNVSSIVTKLIQLPPKTLCIPQLAGPASTKNEKNNSFFCSYEIRKIIIMIIIILIIMIIAVMVISKTYLLNHNHNPIKKSNKHIHLRICSPRERGFTYYCSAMHLRIAVFVGVGGTHYCLHWVAVRNTELDLELHSKRYMLGHTKSNQLRYSLR